MDNFILMPKSSELEMCSRKLGFGRTFFSEDFVITESRSKKDLLEKINRTKQKKMLAICRASDEEELRFILEKTKADIVIGTEKICPKDSLHYVRGGLDQILCKAAVANDKIIGFSFQDILNSENQNRARLLARMMLNIKLCRKYKVKMLFSNFAVSETEMRSAKDLEAFWRVLGGEKLFGSSNSEKTIKNETKI